MGELVDLFEAFNGDVGVNLCGGERGVAEKLLYAAQVGPGIEQVRCKAMA